MWSEERTSFSGEHYRIREIAQAAKLPAGERPRILIGGGGRRILRLAGRCADIIGINPKVHEGRVTSHTAADLAPERVREKLAWIAEGAAEGGRSPEDIELNSLTFVVAITDDPKPLREALAKNSGMSGDQVADCPLFLTGPPSEIRERLEQRREEFGISYVVIPGGEFENVERFAEVGVGPLAGT